MLKACVNGARNLKEHPALARSVEELARDVAAAVRAGADAVHLHVKDDEGADNLDGAALLKVMLAVQSLIPGVPIGVTTGAWASPDRSARVCAVQGWSGLPVRPDFASVNWHEDGADDVAAALLDAGVDVEAGLWHVNGAQAWLAFPHRDRCVRVLLELPDGIGDQEVGTRTRQLLHLIQKIEKFPVLLHGEGSSTWPALKLAGELGFSARIGLEDVLELPDGTTAPDNASLVRAAREILAGIHG
ncbi:hypothetical protein GM708_01275 [Vibrio cholerae]|nr:hypothetical protein [Vibrio cholerae]